MTDYSLWPATNGPAADGNDPADISRGVLFRLSAPGWIKKIRFYRGTLDVGNPSTGPTIGRIYTVAGEAAVAGTDVTFTLSGTGWQEADVIPAVPLAANTSYKAVVLTSDYTPTSGYFSTGPGVGGIVSGIITAPDASGAPSGIGAIQQGSFRQPTVGLQYPNQYFNGGNYWVDVVIADEDPGLDVRDVTGTATMATTAGVDSSKMVTSEVTTAVQASASVTDTKQADSATTLTMVAAASVVSEAVGPGVPAPTSEVLCSSWANFVDVPEQIRTELATVTEDQWTVFLLRASELLWAFSGRRWYGGGCTETAVLRSWPSERGTGSWPYHTSWGHCRCWVYGDSGLPNVPWELLPWGFRHIDTPMAIKLPRSPVTGIVSVTIDGDPFTDYRFLRAGWLERLDGHGWNTCSGDTTVTYLYGEPPPLGGKEAALTLAIELARDSIGAECRLPNNVTSITRQGLTIEKLSINDFLDKYRTGLPEVDLWLSAVNPQGRQRAGRVWSPDILPATRSPQ